MPQVTGTTTEDNKSIFTKFTGSATTTSQSFTFSEEQNGMTFRNKGSSAVTLTVDGVTHNIPPKSTIEIDDHQFSSFDVKSAIGTQTFEIRSFVAKTAIRNVNALLADTEQQINLVDFVEKGQIKLPYDFPKTLTFDLYRDDSNLIKHTFKVNDYVKGTNIYLDYVSGNDVNDGLTQGTAVRSLKVALDVANAQASADIIINFVQPLFPRNRFGAITGVTTTIQKNITFKHVSGQEVIIGGFEQDTLLTWTADGTAYKTTRSTTNNVLDAKYRDYRGIPKKLKKVNSAAEVQAEKGTWYTDGSSVWVRRWNDEPIDANVLVIMNVSALDFDISDKVFVMDNVKVFWNVSSYNTLKIRGNANSKLILNNCGFSLGALNGLATLNIGEVYTLNCTSTYNTQDGFNYHGSGGVSPYEFVFEYNSHAYNNGDGSGINNASTCHDGMTMLRVGAVGYECDGPIIADVNGSYSVNYDCTAYNSTKSTDSPTKAGFFFNDSSAVKAGKAYLINCNGGGSNTYAISSDGITEIYVKNFKGKNINSNTNLKYA